MSDFKPCESPGCTACQEIRGLRQLIKQIRATAAEMGGQAGHCEWGCVDAIKDALEGAEA